MEKGSTIYMFSDCNFLSLNILENLLSKNLFVNIVSSSVNSWKLKTLHLNKNKFALIETKGFEYDGKSRYVVFCGGLLKKELAFSDFKALYNYGDFSTSKVLAIFPFECFSVDISTRLKLSHNLAIVYVGDLYGARIDLSSGLRASVLLNDCLTRKKINISNDDVFYPLFVGEVAKTITKWLFSFGPYGKEIFLLGSEVTAESFYKENLKYIPGLKINFIESGYQTGLPRGYEVETIKSSFKFLISETYRWLDRNWNKEEPIFQKKKTPKISPIRINARQRLFISISLLLFFLLLFPFLSLVVSVPIFYYSYKELLIGKSSTFKDGVSVGKTILSLGRFESLSFKGIPILGRPYKESYYAADVGVHLSDMALTAPLIINNSAAVFKQMMGDSSYDPGPLTDNAKTGLNYEYQNLIFLQTETLTSGADGVVLAKYIVARFDFEKYKNLIAESIAFLDRVPDLLGYATKKSYLVLFQNNMELRPTGGFIGSFGVLTFDKGRMSDLLVNDVYSADGQLKGHVEPPLPIKKYLGEANWWFRDSNWDPNFPTSAQRAEWFLGKETDQQVDGVVAVDLNLIQNILKYTGPIFLPDFNLTISDSNLYTETQSEAQDNFFPGTHKKASFLTALSRELISEFSKMDDSSKMFVLKSFFDNLEGRHIQVYVHDDNAENAIVRAGWGGVILKQNCGEACYADSLALVEANLGVNKANFYIQRTANLVVNLTKQGIVRKLTINLSNKANPVLGLAGKYKAYLRLLVPDDTQACVVQTTNGDNTHEVSPDIINLEGRKEIGIPIEILEGQSENISFSWQSPTDALAGVNSYNLFIRKQAGVSDDAWHVGLAGDIGQISKPEGFVLTTNGLYAYNTILSEDFLTKTSW